MAAARGTDGVSAGIHAATGLFELQRSSVLRSAKGECTADFVQPNV